MKKLAPAHRLDWLAREGWNSAELPRLVDIVARLLERDGRLVGRDAPEDLRLALTRQIKAVRRRSEDGQRATQNFVAAALRAYGLTRDEAKSRARAVK
jgi:hypothetical protein